VYISAAQEVKDRLIHIIQQSSPPPITPNDAQLDLQQQIQQSEQKEKSIKSDQSKEHQQITQMITLPFNLGSLRSLVRKNNPNNPNPIFQMNSISSSTLNKPNNPSFFTASKTSILEYSNSGSEHKFDNLNDQNISKWLEKLFQSILSFITPNSPNNPLTMNNNPNDPENNSIYHSLLYSSENPTDPTNPDMNAIISSSSSFDSNSNPSNPNSLYSSSHSTRSNHSTATLDYTYNHPNLTNNPNIPYNPPPVRHESTSISKISLNNMLDDVVHQQNNSKHIKISLSSHSQISKHNSHDDDDDDVLGSHEYKHKEGLAGEESVHVSTHLPVVPIGSASSSSVKRSTRPAAMSISVSHTQSVHMMRLLQAVDQQVTLKTQTTC